MTRVRWTALALAMAALPAWAQEAPPPAEQTIHHVEAATPAPGKLEPFDAIDRNADGFLQWEEVRNQIVKLFLVFSAKRVDHADRYERRGRCLRAFRAGRAAVHL